MTKKEGENIMHNKNPRMQKFERVTAPVLAAVAILLVPLIVSFNRPSEKAEASFALSSSADSFDIEASSTDSEPQLSKIEEFESTSAAASELKSLGKFSLTAYCPCVKCCGEWSKEHPSRIGTDYIQKTASGTIPKAGRTIGVDPDIIPYGTVVIINDHEYVAEDCGGGVNGNSIDIFFDDHNEALEFGRQTAEVFIKN